MSDAAGQHNLISYVVTIVIVSFVLALRMRRLSQTRPLKLEWLWVVPAIYALIAAGMFASYPPTSQGWAFSALALVIGAGIGWQRGRMMHIEVDPETHVLNQKASPAAILFVIILIALRLGTRAAAQASGSYLHLNAMAATDLLIAFALGLFVTQRVEMFLRARRLLDAARAGRMA